MSMRLFMEFALGDLASAGIKKITNGLAAAGEEGKRVAKSFEDMGDALAGGIKAAGLAREIKTALLDPGVAAASEIEAALRRLQVELDGSSAADIADQMERARREADRIQAVTSLDSGGVLDIITNLRKSGFKMGDVLGKGGGAEAAAFLSTAEGGLSSDRAATGVALLTNKFGLAGDKLTQGADLLVRYGAASDTNAAELIDALGNISGAGELGMTPQETLGLLATLANAGKKGAEGGTAASAFIRQLVAMEKNSGGKLSAFDKKGNFRGLEAVAADLRGAFGSLTVEKQQQLAQGLFGDEGKAAAFALIAAGDKSLEAVQASAAIAQGLQERINIIAAGFGATMESLEGTTRSTMARLFEPALAPLTRGASLLNTAAAKLGDMAAESPWMGQVTTGLAAGGTVAAGVYALAQFGKAGLSGIKGLAGLGGLSKGVAAGKALETAAGVTPVYVVNANEIGMGLPAAPGLPASGGAGQAAKGLGLLGPIGAGAAIGTAVGVPLADALNSNEMFGAVRDNAIWNNGVLMAAMRMFGSEDQNKRYDQARSERVGDLAKLLNLKVEVNVDSQGGATVLSDIDALDVVARQRGAP